ncbi:DUF3320 domain-containing protein [Aquisalimonas sp.]|uniref:DUF3320 domain-containing protein n=1 Tax=Aquisalimonas sp. TaxID=1872621 RepID=UPI003456FB95
MDVEGPVPFQVLADRLLTAADVGRLGFRIRARIEGQLDQLHDAGDLVRCVDFFWAIGPLPGASFAGLGVRAREDPATRSCP